MLKGMVQKKSFKVTNKSEKINFSNLFSHEKSNSKLRYKNSLNPPFLKWHHYHVSKREITQGKKFNLWLRFFLLIRQVFSFLPLFDIWFMSCVPKSFLILSRISFFLLCTRFTEKKKEKGIALWNEKRWMLLQKLELVRSSTAWQ